MRIFSYKRAKSLRNIGGRYGVLYDEGRKYEGYINTHNRLDGLGYMIKKEEKEFGIFDNGALLFGASSFFDKEIKVDDTDVLLPMACGGKVTLFYEFIGPKQYVYIFGGGHCGAALTKLLKPLGFYVAVIDDRKDVIDALDDSADEKICCDFVKYIEENHNLNNRYVVVATPSHKSDYDVLDKIFELNLKPKYFGMLCSKKKVADYLNRLKETHKEELDLSNFYAPIGLQTGGDSPEEVAISIASEILTIYYEKDKINCHMRDK